MILRKTFHLLSPSLKKYPFRNTCAFSIDNPRFNPQKDYYQILNLSHHASKHQINDAYANLANLYYSDRDKGVGTRFGDITEAYRVLSDDTLRE